MNHMSTDYSGTAVNTDKTDRGEERGNVPYEQTNDPACRSDPTTTSTTHSWEKPLTSFDPS